MHDSFPMARIDWWSLSDRELAGQCGEDRYRASGPGGQKKNKTSSAIRLRHRPTGLVVVAHESRSQHENRRRALRRLREGLAFDVRQPINPLDLAALRARLGATGLDIGPREFPFLPVAAAVLDLLNQGDAEPAPVARRLGVTTGQLLRFLRASPPLWRAVQELRTRHARRPLR